MNLGRGRLTTAADAVQSLGEPAQVAVNPVMPVVRWESMELIEERQVLFGVLRDGMEWNGGME